MRAPTAGDACSSREHRLTYAADVCIDPMRCASCSEGSTSRSKREATSASSSESPCASAMASSKACFTNFGLLPRWKTRWSCESTHTPSLAVVIFSWHALRQLKYTCIECGPSMIGCTDRQPTGL